MSPAADAVIRRLDGARQKWWIFTLLSTAVLAVCTSFGLLLAFMATDALLMFSQLTLAALFLLWLVVSVALAAIVFRRMARSHRSLEATARRVEWEFPELGSDLINVVQLSSDRANENRAFCEAAVSEAAVRAARWDVEKAAGKESRWGRFRHCMQTPRDLLESTFLLGLLVAAAIACQMYLPNWGSAANRLLSPWEFIPSVGSVGEIRVKPGDTELLVGTSLEITAEIANPNARQHKAFLYIRPDNEPETELAMVPDENFRVWAVSLPAVVKGLGYRIQIGDSQTRVFRVEVREKPTFAEVEVTYRYPAYLERRPEIFMQKTADLEAPMCTEAELRVHPSTPIAKAYLQIEGQRIVGAVENGGAQAVMRMPLVRDASFTVHLETASGQGDPNPRMNRVRVIADKPPAVELLKPGPLTTTTPGGDVPVMIRARDDYGVGLVRLEMKVEKGAAAAESSSPAAGDEPPSVVSEWTRFEGKTNVVIDHRLALGERARNGDAVKIRAVALDKRNFANWGQDLRPQEAVSPWSTIRVITEEAKVAATLEQLDSLRGAIFKILESQMRARIKAAAIAKEESAQARAAAAGEVRAEQSGIQKAGQAVVQMVTDTDKADRQAIKRAMNNLTVGAMVDAITKAEALARLSDADAFAGPAIGLTGTQDVIIEALRKMLDVTRRAQAEAIAEAPKRAVGDLPPDVKQKLEDAKRKLEEFLKQQKKVIEASENLAKMPVENFKEKEEEQLKAMAATEDDWARFMKDLHSDLSKLPEQDFANPTLAKELNEIQTELKMAADALLKKSADIAVPLEQLGAERAEEIKTNFEKWLPDTPDREKWSQEEALGDKDKEAPMAELPGELEDLIGELMEEEEDLMAEAEDVSSSAIDSLDKGAAWDAADGPISNNSAKGVTGNRLPGTNELGGRSGEGRSAKSSGEFVGDEAVGKGGRKTPSRLTPDPYLAGQVKDHSKDEQGGASGGGKESGQGREGLEGPAPRQPERRDLARLAGKQAALRNKAEGVDLQFQVAGFHRTDLKKLIEIMGQVERDFAAGRYENVLRQRQLLANTAGDIKQYLKGEFQVRKDTSANLPAEIQKDILGGMSDASPAGWEEVNREYFERLATSGAVEAVPGTPAK